MAEQGESAGPWPSDIRVRDGGRLLVVRFESGEEFALPAEYLRVSSPSAEVQGHGAQDRKVVGGKRSVALTDVQPVGTYAVRLVFDDQHATGIFTWVYLHELGARQAERWSAYLAALASKGLSRDRPGQA